jgi:hypothetical protein
VHAALERIALQNARRNRLLAALIGVVTAAVVLLLILGAR